MRDFMIAIFVTLISYLLISNSIALAENSSPNKVKHTNQYVCNKTKKPHVFKCVNMKDGTQAICTVNDNLKFDCDPIKKS